MTLKNAMVLAAGFGTRLRPLTLEKPKPLIPIAGVPLIDVTLGLMLRAGIERVAVNTHYLGEQITTHLSQNWAGLVKHVVHEAEILGTAGGLRSLYDVLQPDGPVLVMNADALIDLDIEALYQRHSQNKSDVTLVLRDAPEKDQYGTLGVNREGFVRSILNDGFNPDDIAARYMFCGIHIIEPHVFKRIPIDTFSGTISDIYPKLLQDGIIGAYMHDGYFDDIGTIDRLNRNENAILDGSAAFHFLQF